MNSVKKPAVLHQHGFVASLGGKSQFWIEDTYLGGTMIDDIKRVKVGYLDFCVGIDQSTVKISLMTPWTLQWNL